MTGLAAKWDMEVYASHGVAQRCGIRTQPVSFDAMGKGLWVLLWSWLVIGGVIAQPVQVQYQLSGADTKPAWLQSRFARPALWTTYLQRLPARLLADGYLAASIDSLAGDSLQPKVYLYLGQRYQWQRWNPDSTAASWLVRAGLQPADWLQGKLTPDSLMDLLLQTTATRGFPFAQAGWDSISLQPQGISARLWLQPGQPYRVDSLVQQGKLRLKPRFLYSYLGLRPGIPFSDQLPAAIDQRLSSLPFATIARPTEVLMLPGGSQMLVTLQPRRSNVFNLLVGLMPASTQTPDGRLQLTGDANLLLRNTFGNGETISANWQQIQYKSPRLNLGFQQAYLFGPRTGLDFQFELFKKDTQFLNLQTRIGLPYQWSLSQRGQVFYQFQQNTVATVDTLFAKQNKRLPDIADFSLSQLGLQWNSQRLDDAINPSRGHDGALVLLAGLKNIKPSESIRRLDDATDFDYNSLYDSLKLKTYQMRLRGHYAQYLHLGGNQVLKFAGNAGWLLSSSYFRNELFQIGGFKLLRGFDEESIYAQGFGVLSAEYRLLTGRSSYLFGFADGGWARYTDELTSYQHSYLGMGLGMFIETKNSQINLSWAVGKRNDLPLSFRQSKIHLGFINFF